MDRSFSDHVYVGSLSDLGFRVLYQYTNTQIDPTYFTKLDQKKFVSSTVSKKNTDITDEKIRASKIYKNCSIEVKPLKSYDYSRKLDTTKVKPLKNSLECSIGYSFDLIKYEKGDHFNEFHYDTFTNGNVATLLIFYPSEYTGGDLVFNIEGVEHVVKTSEFKDVMCVIFGNVLHKCTPITSGVRYVIKGIVKAELPEILSESHKFKLEDILSSMSSMQESTDYTKQIQDTRKELEDIITKYYMNKIEYHKQNLPSKLDDVKGDKNIKKEYEQAHRKLRLLENYDTEHKIGFDLNEKKYNICVLPYYIDSMKDFTKYQKSTLDYIANLIKNGWNVTGMYETFNFKTEYEDGDRRLDGITFYHKAIGKDDEYDCYGCGSKESKYTIDYSEYDVENGKCLDFYSEYNDQSGDDIYEEYECSCLLVWK